MADPLDSVGVPAPDPNPTSAEANKPDPALPVDSTDPNVQVTDAVGDVEVKDVEVKDAEVKDEEVKEEDVKDEEVKDVKVKDVKVEGVKPDVTKDQAIEPFKDAGEQQQASVVKTGPEHQAEPKLPKPEIKPVRNEPTRTASPANVQPLQWSSYLKRAVANVEQTLDKVLQESATEISVPIAKPTPPSRTVSSASGAKLTMQERLAMVVGRPSSTTPSASDSERPSIERAIERSSTSEDERKPSTDSVRTSSTVLRPLKAPGGDVEPGSLESTIDITRELTDIINGLSLSQADTESLNSTLTSLSRELDVQQLRFATFESRQQERLDAVESKLVVLSKAEIERAKQAKGSTQGPEKKIAEKDEYIALLLEEGQMLSKQELKHMNTIKKLRAKERGVDKTVEVYTRQIEKLEKELADTKTKLKRSQDSEKSQAETLRSMGKADAELAVLRREKSALTAENSRLNKQLSEKLAEYEGKEAKAREEALAQANTEAEALRTQLADVTDELQITTDRLKGEINGLNNQLSNEGEAASKTQAALRDEIRSLQALAEHYRSLTEDVSSGASHKDAQLNLLRQIEVLQSQHSVARENWHGIEANLLGRVSSLETELEETKKNESYARKKLKAVTDSLKESTENLEHLHEQNSELEAQLFKVKNDLQKVKTQLDEEIENHRQAIAALDTDKGRLESELTIAQEKVKSAEDDLQRYISQQADTTDMSIPPLDSAPMSPPAMTAYGEKKRSVSGLDIFLGGGSPMPSSSHSGFQSPELHRIQSRLMSISGETNGSSELSEENEFFDDSATQGPQSAGDNASLYTGSTSGGVSLQLVGKMNSTIRKLESDLASTRQDLTKMKKARDDAYQEVIKLMKESEQASVYKEEAVKLEERVKELESREQTTLEILGEKSEMVQELRADVDDLKAMYRQQIEELVDQLQAAKAK